MQGTKLAVSCYLEPRQRSVLNAQYNTVQRGSSDAVTISDLVPGCHKYVNLSILNSTVQVFSLQIKLNARRIYVRQVTISLTPLKVQAEQISNTDSTISNISSVL